MRYWYIGSGLRSLIGTVEWPDVDIFKEWMSAFTAAFKDAARGTRFADLLSFLAAPHKPDKYDERKQTFLSQDLYDQLYSLIYPPSQTRQNALRSAYDGSMGHDASLPSAGYFVPTITRGRITYSTSAAGLRNSLVILPVAADSPSGTVKHAAGRIERIFYHRRCEGRSSMMVEPFLIVKQYTPLSSEHENADPFRGFPGLDTQLYYNKLQPQERVIRFSDVIAHFAALTYTPEGIEKECIVARSLDRVCGHIRICVGFTNSNVSIELTCGGDTYYHIVRTDAPSRIQSLHGASAISRGVAHRRPLAWR